MGNISLFDSTVHLLRANMDRRNTSQQLISRNIANLETPGYTGTGLEFEKQLKAAVEGGIVPTPMAKTNPGHMPMTDPKPFDHAPGEYKDTGEVNLDIEMSKLAENNIMFNAMVTMLGKKYSLLKHAITNTTGG